MDQTFITIHNLEPDANILFASESITDILGYQPHEVQNKSCFEFFHPDEVLFARSIHSRGVLLDKAAVLHYGRILSSRGVWVRCECCFTIVHDVLVASTSIYRRSSRSERRALEAPQIRRIFSCSAKDPRYHMLEHLSPRFQTPAADHEPRAALILNRFTRSLCIMFSTSAVAAILGIPSNELQDQSFYDCIQERCLEDAFKCLEGAKSNDSIVYLRFWSRDPRQPRNAPSWDSAKDEGLSERDDALAIPSPGSENGISLSFRKDVNNESSRSSTDRFSQVEKSPHEGPKMKRSVSEPPAKGFLEMLPSNPSGHPRRRGSLESNTEDDSSTNRLSHSPSQAVASYELEAVVSCTSDGLVVVLRRARPPNPGIQPPQPPTMDDGPFAAPWAQEPIRIDPSYMDVDEPGPPASQSLCYSQERPDLCGLESPSVEHFMGSIRDVAVFAWALVGINSNLAAFSQGQSQCEAISDRRALWSSDTCSSHMPQEPRDLTCGTEIACQGGSCMAKSTGATYNARWTSSPYIMRFACSRPHYDTRSEDKFSQQGREVIGQPIHGSNELPCLDFRNPLFPTGALSTASEWLNRPDAASHFQDYQRTACVEGENWSRL